MQAVPIRRSVSQASPSQGDAGRGGGRALSYLWVRPQHARALHFHHVDPSSKRHEINAKGVAIALDKLRVEARKCVLLCSNCHAEVEDGTVVLPADALAPPSG